MTRVHYTLYINVIIVQYSLETQNVTMSLMNNWLVC